MNIDLDSSGKMAIFEPICLLFDIRTSYKMTTSNGQQVLVCNCLGYCYSEIPNLLVPGRIFVQQISQLLVSW